MVGKRMKPIEKPNTLDIVRTSLQEAIMAGQWRDRLAGTRILAKSLGVSAPTVGLALERLVKEGILSHEGPRRAYRLTEKARRMVNKPKFTGQRELLILTHEDVRELVDDTRQVIEALMRQMVAKGWLVKQQVLDYKHAKKPQKSWSRLIDRNPYTKVIAVYGSPSLAAWSTRKRIPMLFLGGDAGEHAVPTIGVVSSIMAEVALGHLLALGHDQIVFPLCDRNEKFKSTLMEVTKNAMGRAGHRYMARYHNPVSGYTGPDVMRRLLTQVFAVRQPTALVLLDWSELIAAYCFLTERGLRVPEDVSLVMLSDVVSAHWFHPDLCRFRFPRKKLVSLMIKWLEERPGSEMNHLLAGTWLAGKSIAPPKPTRPV
jgi:DNA-binding LacI/PurR family transcriptional regulator